jgi:hypothetical protein
MHYLLFYDYAADYLQRRGEFRSAHLTLAWGAMERGELVLGGALDEPMDAGVLMFQAESPDVVEAFVAADPYVKGGLVTSWRIRPWHTVVGSGATTPLHP